MKQKRAKGYFKFLKKRNVKLFSFFLIAAFFFLMLTKLSQSYTQNIKVKVELQNLEEDIVILNDSSAMARVTVKARGFSLLSYLFNPKKIIQIDAKSEASKLEGQIAWDIGNNKFKLKQALGNPVDILSVKPDSVFFDYDKLASKIVPATLIYNLSFMEGFDVVNSVKLSQDSVKIVGSETELNKIDSVKTEALVLKEMNTNINANVNLVNEFSNVKIIPEKLEVSGEVKRFTEGKLSIPVTLKKTSKLKNINYFPKHIDLVFYVDIENYKTIKPEDFQIVADFSKLNSDNQNTLSLEIKEYPNIVKNVRLLQNSIEFIISD